jgi:hypothetical protein
MFTEAVYSIQLHSCINKSFSFEKLVGTLKGSHVETVQDLQRKVAAALKGPSANFAR